MKYTIHIFYILCGPFEKLAAKAMKGMTVLESWRLRQLPPWHLKTSIQLEHITSLKRGSTLEI